MKNYDRYPGENCIFPTPPAGPSASGLEAELAQVPAKTAPEYPPLYNAAFYGIRAPKLASQEPVLLRSESAQQRYS